MAVTVKSAKEIELMREAGRRLEIVHDEMAAYCFLLFVLLYFPCIATIAAIKGETGSWKWAEIGRASCRERV